MDPKVSYAVDGGVLFFVQLQKEWPLSVLSY